MTDDRLSPGYAWPDGYDRTPADERGSYPGDLSVTRKEAFQSIPEEIDRWGGHDVWVNTASQHYVDEPNRPHGNKRPGDPSVVVRYRKEDDPADVVRNLPCDRWATQLENARAIALYARRQRLAERCGVSLGQSTHETARLPPGDEDTGNGVVAVGPPDPLDGRDPHEVLGVGADATDEAIRLMARQKKGRHHPDGQDPDPDEFEAVKAAEEELLGEGGSA